ncbi:sirohydrochlorin cobaltochelatase [Candidatus Enterococcus murrayae]|uniref:Sirohydrochlorin cobaltochelatase n=1 Tax=Candidatus Enterococcus murrayae TaxID=2815321 RepID=A0ABS3HGV0_9ENTE|nr:sirohydrochlorin cobaltochelatase [Enterococcus sp. MJM16]MBO0452145.1 sirohydrochlorin cobaltochelatase [Enterococcus sp. MJM16]
MKPALIVVSFGTSYVETRKKTIDVVEKKIAQAYPEFDTFRAFTSNKVIKKIKEQEKMTVLTVDQQMKKLVADGYEEIYVQPLHIIPGSEYSKALHQAMRYKDQLKLVKIGKPLLSDVGDYQKIVGWLELLSEGFAEDEALMLMGHGSQHSAFTVYACLDHMLMEKPIFVCAVESYPEISLLISRLQKSHYKKIKLYPLMLVAGDHAVNDMASDEEDSWKSQLEKAGFYVETILKGMGEAPEIQQQFIDHVGAMIEGMTNG